MPRVRHLHRFQRTTHVDGCHYFDTRGRCDCGSSIVIFQERDIEEDPYSMAWMGPVAERPCPRCRELLWGDAPKAQITVRPRARG